MGHLIFLACDLLTGRVLTELPLEGLDAVTQTIAAEESQSFNLPVYDDRCPPDWGDILADGKTMIVARTEHGHLPGAWVMVQKSYGDEIVPLECGTLEHLLARCYVPAISQGESLERYSTDAALILRDVLRSPSESFGFTVETVAGCDPIDQAWFRQDNAAVLDVAADMMKAEGGPEWRTRVRWADDAMTRVEKVLEVAPRVGVDRPNAVFSMDVQGNGSVDAYTRAHDYSTEKGATSLIGVPDGSESYASQRYEAADLLALGWPRWEARPTITGLDNMKITDPDAALERRAQAELKRRRLGARVWTVTGNEHCPQPGADFDLGDRVRIRIRRPDREDPVGGERWVRVMGWSWRPDHGFTELRLWDEGDDQ